MSGVYIKGMEMPKDCVVCPFGWNGCNKQHDFVYMGSRPDNCPLVPVPPHGRLIDADALLSLDRQIYDGEIAVGRREYIFCFEVDDAPTIIPAEEGDDDV